MSLLKLRDCIYWPVEFLYKFGKSRFDKTVMGRGGGHVCCFTLANLIKTAAVCMYIIPFHCLPAALNIDTTDYIW